MENETKGTHEGYDFTELSESISQNQMLDAADTLRDYFKKQGTGWTYIDWGKKPELPENISRAWDVYNTFWARVRDEGVLI